MIETVLDFQLACNRHGVTKCSIIPGGTGPSTVTLSCGNESVSVQAHDLAQACNSAINYIKTGRMRREGGAQ